jgi:hypothetical protein
MNGVPPDVNGPMDPYLFVFLFIGGGLVALIAAFVTDNNVVTSYTAKPDDNADAHVVQEPKPPS